jgi:hypothetical protein
MAVTIADIFNTWNEIGVFSYVLPFLLIFAVVYAIIDKTKLLYTEENPNRGIAAIIAVSIGLLSLQFDFVSNFFAVIFPRFGIGLSILLVFIIFVGFFLPAGNTKGTGFIGWAIFAGVVIWAISSWGSWSGATGFGGWFAEYAWAIIVLGVIIGLIVLITRDPVKAAAAKAAAKAAANKG